MWLETLTGFREESPEQVRANLEVDAHCHVIEREWEYLYVHDVRDSRRMEQSLMTVATWDSREARAQWRHLLDTAAAGESDIVITRYGKPVATIIDYEDYLALQEELDDLRAARRADLAYAEYQRDPSTARPYREIRAELVADGLLYDAI